MLSPSGRQFYNIKASYRGIGWHNFKMTLKYTVSAFALVLFILLIGFCANGLQKKLSPVKDNSSFLEVPSIGNEYGLRPNESSYSLYGTPLTVDYCVWHNANQKNNSYMGGVHQEFICALSKESVYRANHYLPMALYPVALGNVVYWGKISGSFVIIPNMGK